MIEQKNWPFAALETVPELWSPKKMPFSTF
jgi:hypothetical protein